MNSRCLITIQDKEGKIRKTTLGQFVEDNRDDVESVIWVVSRLARGLDAAIGGGASPLFRISLYGVPKPRGTEDA